MDFKSFFERLSVITNSYPWLLPAWLTFGVVVGFAALFVIGHIPVIFLGGLFGLVGALVHVVIVTLQKTPYFWLAGGAIAAVAFAITAMMAPVQIWLGACASYFVFGSLYYLLLERLFLRTRT